MGWEGEVLGEKCFFDSRWNVTKTNFPPLGYLYRYEIYTRHGLQATAERPGGKHLLLIGRFKLWNSDWHSTIIACRLLYTRLLYLKSFAASFTSRCNSEHDYYDAYTLYVLYLCIILVYRLRFYVSDENSSLISTACAWNHMLHTLPSRILQ